MEPNDISLLWPPQTWSKHLQLRELNVATIENLDLNTLCRRLTADKDRTASIRYILTHLCCEEAVIRFRQDIFQELYSSDSLLTSMGEAMGWLKQLKHLSKESNQPEDAALWGYFARFKELEGYISCVSAIRLALDGFELKSLGLSRLKAYITALAESDGFHTLSDAIEKLNMEVNEIQSITLGINLDSSLSPVEATLLSVNKTRYRDKSWLRSFFLSSNSGINPDDLGMMSRVHGVSQNKRHPVMYHLYNDIESLLKPVVKDMSSSLRKFSSVRTEGLLGMIDELSFYLEFARLYKGLEAAGLPLCLPIVINKEDRKCVIQNSYNINLALHFMQQGIDSAAEMVLNDVRFDEHGRILILTGPNRGGKTVYTEAIGLAQILFQAGLFVPGSCAEISPVDMVFSHFPVDENQTVELGRLGEEAKRLSEIFQMASRFSLVLLNESLASTSFTEGLYIAKDVVMSLKFLEARALFNTHIHDLAGFADAINMEVPGDSQVVSLVTGLIGNKRSYKVTPGAPLGKSYAQDIAQKYGVSYEQIAAAITSRKK